MKKYIENWKKFLSDSRAWFKAGSVLIMISPDNAALIFWSPFQNWRLKWWPGSGVKCWKPWSVKCCESEMRTGPGTQETWLPVSVLSWSLSVPVGISHLWGSILLSQNEALELMRAEILFKLKFYEWVLWIFFK